MTKKSLYFLLPVILLTVLIYFKDHSTQKHLNQGFFDSINIDQSKSFKDRVVAMAFNKKSMLLAIGYESGLVDIFDGTNESKSMSFRPTENRSNILTFSHNGKYLTVGSDFSDTTYIYDMDTKSFYLSLDETRGKEIFTSDDKYLILSNSNELKLYDMTNDQFLKTLRTPGYIDTLAINEDETMIATGSSTGTVELFSFEQTSEKEKTASITSISKVEIPHIERCNINQIYFKDNQVITLTSFAEFQKGNEPLLTEKMDVWSTPDLTNMQTLTLKAKTITQAIMNDNKEFIIGLGVNKFRKEGRYFVELIDINNNISEIIARVSTNFPNITKWSQPSNDEQELVFVEHNRKKMLLQIDKPPYVLN